MPKSYFVDVCGVKIEVVQDDDGRFVIPDGMRGLGGALKPAFEPALLFRKPLAGTVAENVLRHGTGAINIDGCRVPSGGDVCGTSKSHSTPQDGWDSPWRHDEAAAQRVFNAKQEGNRKAVEIGRFPANLVHDGSPEVLAIFPDSAGSGGSVPNTRVAGYGAVQEYHGGERQKHDAGSGSAARFFYCAKASKRDRDEGLEGFEARRTGAMDGNCGHSGQRTAGDGVTPIKPPARANIHPTVKPTDLMRYLCRLITPPGGTVLDPFTGSGSTGKAAMLEGFRFIGCEMDPEYWLIAHARIDAAARSCNTDTASTTEEE